MDVLVRYKSVNNVHKLCRCFIPLLFLCFTHICFFHNNKDSFHKSSISSALLVAMKCRSKRKSLLFRNFCTVSYHMSVLYFIKKKIYVKGQWPRSEIPGGCGKLVLFLVLCCILHDTEGGGSRWMVQRAAECRPPATLSQADTNLLCPVVSERQWRRVRMDSQTRGPCVLSVLLQ